MKYCPDCAAEIILRVPENDQFQRHVCSRCERIFYQNPLIVTACIVEKAGKIMLCKRGIEPRLGYWTIPGGFLEYHETTEQCAIRETKEEADATVAITQLHGVYSLPKSNQVHIIYRGQMQGEHYAITHESTEIIFCYQDEIDWDNIAFQVVKQSLLHYYKVCDKVQSAVHQMTIL